MSRVLHSAIRDALRDTRAYEEKAIAVSTVLESTADVAADEGKLYDAVYRLFAAMPERLLRSSVLLISTQDTDDATELAWDAREEFAGTLPEDRDLLSGYPDTHPIRGALLDLERYCQMRAGHVRARVEAVKNSSAFARPAHVHRRVIAHLPRRDAALGLGHAVPHATPLVTEVARAGKPQRGTDASSDRRLEVPVRVRR